jgi:hypothetical protein
LPDRRCRVIFPGQIQGQGQRPSAAEASSLTLSSSSALLATSATSAPAAESAIAVALPKPLLAPVTSAVLPRSPPFRDSPMLYLPPMS